MEFSSYLVLHNHLLITPLNSPFISIHLGTSSCFHSIAGTPSYFIQIPHYSLVRVLCNLFTSVRVLCNPFTFGRVLCNPLSLFGYYATLFIFLSGIMQLSPLLSGTILLLQVVILFLGTTQPSYPYLGYLFLSFRYTATPSVVSELWNSSLIQTCEPNISFHQLSICFLSSTIVNSLHVMFGD